MKTEPLVSIIIATYNRASMLPDAIRSVLQQTYSNKQIIVVDDGSTDDTAAVVKTFPQVEYVYQQHSRQAAARNNGWQHSTGEYIATLDSDDRWDPDFLRTCVVQIEKEKLDFVFANWEQQRIEGGSFDFISNDPLLIPYLHRQKDSWVNLEGDELRQLYVHGCPSPSSSLVLRASSLGGWNENMHIGDDWCMLLDIILSGSCRAAFTLEKLWHKFINSDNIYDGRDHIEVNRLLYVEDMHTLMMRYASSWTKEEYKYLERRYLRHLVRSAKHSLTTYSKLGESFGLMKRAVRTNPVYALRVLTKLAVGMGQRQFNKEAINGHQS